jgi:hypothetical protein
MGGLVKSYKPAFICAAVLVCMDGDDSNSLDFDAAWVNDMLHLVPTSPAHPVIYYPR